MTSEEVRRIRARLGLTGRAFGELVGVHEMTVSRWENGHLPISERTAKHIRLIEADLKPRKRHA